MNERDRIWIELYESDELKRAAKYLIRFSNLHEDLLSDAIIKVFESRLDYTEIHRAGNLKGYVFSIMSRSVRTRTARVNGEQWARFDKWAQRYGLVELRGDELAEEYGDVESVSLQPEVITDEELKYAHDLFGEVTQLRVKLMRKIDEAEQKRDSDPDLWSAAQYAKLYLHHGSLRKVSATTGTKFRQVQIYIDRFKAWASEKEKMKVTVVTRSNEPQSGMELYRLYYPYFDGIATYHNKDFAVSHITYDYLEKQPAEELSSDVYVFSRIQKHVKSIADRVYNEGKKCVLDIDDYWHLHSDHPMRDSDSNKDYVSTITEWLPKAHMVTTTSARLAERMKIEYDVDAVVIKNTIPESAEQFKGDKYPSSQVRIGWIGGTHHIEDLELMRPALRKLHGDPRLTGYQICLAGFNNNAHFVKYESVLTADNYLIRADEDYIDYLKATKDLNSPMLEHIAYHKPYKRIWAKPVTTYGQGYRQMDAVFIPLQGGNLFNNCKSELKLIEAGTTKTAVIVSDVPPYSDHLDHEANCLKVSSKAQDWFTQTRRMIMDRDLREETANNLHTYIAENFNHKTETNKLSTALKRLK